MKKIAIIMLVCFLTAFGVSPGIHAQAAATDTVNIPDQNLLTGLKKILTKPFATSLTEGDLAQLDIAKINYSNPADAYVPGKVSDLTGLEYATNMTQIDFSASNVSDLTPILHLPNLKKITGVQTSLRSLDGIQNLPALEDLELGADYIQDFSPLLEAENLTRFSYNSYRWLSSDYSAISDLTILSEMQKLQVLDLTWNEVSDLSPLRGNDTINTLNLNHNKVQDLAPLEDMNNLVILYLNQNELTSLNDLSTLKGMKILYADSNHIVDIAALNPLFNSMIKEGDYKGLQINNQTITLPTITIKQGETATSTNPTKGLDGQVMPIQTASSEGEVSSDSKTVSWDNITADTNATYNIAATDQSAAGVDFSYSLKVTQPIKVLAANSSEVNVKYVDTAGNELAPADTITGVVGDAYNTTAKTIDGWNLKETPANANGTFSDTAQTVTYVYEKAPVAGQDVTVQYVDEAGNELATSDTLSGNVGDAYTSTAKTMDGWNLKETPANATGTFSDTAQTVTYVYEKAPVAGQDVTVQYVDEAGKELATSDTLSGNVGEAYTSTAKTIDGWNLKETPANATGTFSDTAQTVTYVYEKAAVAGQDVTVQYVDTAGKELATSDTLSGSIGDTYSSTAKDIDGWLLETTPVNATGTFSDTAQTVTYVYEKEVVAGQDVTVKYVDEAGNELAPSDTLSGNVGDAYNSTAKGIEGWKLKTAPSNATGTFSDTAQTVTYVYEEKTDTIIPVPEDPTTPNDKTTDGKSNVTPTGKMSIQPTDSLNPTKQAKEKTSLPKTGDSAQNSGMLAGLVLLLFGAALLTRRQTKKNK
ncbi:LPXTG cell wall anchor domain-containing protein [Listeria seeligeri]|uniref:MucBP domain-containing protein n=1 Tax=Listeria seeligeri TaxID=1640 RepID=UPI0016263271|nr:MucBP domain-containing protein [Listeria seeligeri]MBC1826037.1 LPXTG cell wall anchor domain-containing protein [Listeria seeligeri]MBC6120053.1 LPXTG cell wall anchor domain-containing protein [Listeria seeligeri]MBC6143560.1 LPXTG cell wall anchor domain-containing protein [Listeria seeligeri]